ncbi:MAG: PfkB family carbohydrate kinase [Treponema sp.]|nr:PfkB family carbohydrate kinase [Treponema sp.]
MHDVIYLTYPVCDINVLLTEPLPLYAERTNVATGMSLVPGGGANTLFAASRLGLDIVPLGVVGNDNFGRIIIEGYEREGVSVLGLELREGYNTLGVIVLNGPDGKHGYASMLSGSFVKTLDLDALLTESRAVCLSGYMYAAAETREETMAFMQKARAFNKTIFFDPGPLALDPGLVETTFALSDVLALNDAEAARWTGVERIEDAARDLAGRCRGTVAVKSGEKGCYLFAGGEGRWHRGFDVKVLDTTGAGDVFLGAFMRGYIDGWDLDSAAALANAAGAATAAKQGTGPDVAAADEILAVLVAAGYAVTRTDLLNRAPFRLVKDGQEPEPFF